MLIILFPHKLRIVWLAPRVHEIIWFVLNFNALFYSSNFSGSFKFENFTFLFFDSWNQNFNCLFFHFKIFRFEIYLKNNDVTHYSHSLTENWSSNLWISTIFLVFVLIATLYVTLQVSNKYFEDDDFIISESLIQHPPSGLYFCFDRSITNWCNQSWDFVRKIFQKKNFIFRQTGEKQTFSTDSVKEKMKFL